MVSKTNTKIKKLYLDLAVIKILATSNTTRVTLTDTKGCVLAWTTPGSMGYKNNKKRMPIAAAQVANNIVKKATEMCIKEFVLHIAGFGSGRDSALRTFVNSSLVITTLKDITPNKHNGCRPKKARKT